MHMCVVYRVRSVSHAVVSACVVGVVRATLQ